MKSFKENAEYLQSQAEAFNGINAFDVRILFNQFMVDLWVILNQKEEHEANLISYEALKELRDLKSKDDEKSN